MIVNSTTSTYLLQNFTFMFARAPQARSSFSALPAATSVVSADWG